MTAEMPPKNGSQENTASAAASLPPSAITGEARETLQKVQRGFADVAVSLGLSRLAALAYASREDALTCVGLVGITDERLHSLTLPPGQFAAVERALRTQEIVFLATPDGFPSLLTDFFSGETVVIPLRLDGRGNGALIGKTGVGIFPRSPAWQEQAKEVALRAALLVELERVGTAYREELERRQVTRTMAASILEGMPMREIAGLICAVVADRLRVERVALYLRDAKQGVIPLALRNVSPAYANGLARLSHPAPIAARAMATGLPVHARDLLDDASLSPEIRELFRRENIHSILVARLHHGEAIKGMLTVYPPDDRVFTPTELSIFQSLADMATLGIAISQQLEQQREMAMMQERNRLAREMHDTVAQTLAAVLMQIDTACDHLARNSLPQAQEMLTLAQAQTKKALEDTRRAVQGLSPVALESLSPAQAIEQEAQQMQEQLGLPVLFKASGDEHPLTPEQQTALLRIAQEALTNAGRHAHPLRIRVGLHYTADDVTLLVEDDGAGFDVHAVATPDGDGGYGLFGMNERARLAGGDLDIDSTPGWGTRIRLRLPLEKGEEGVQISRYSGVQGGETAVSQTVQTANQPTQDLTTRIPEYPNVIRVLIADDHAMTRQGMRTLLEAEGEFVVVGEAENGREAVERAHAVQPDVALMDVQMPEVDGIEALRRLRREQPNLPVVIVTTIPTDAVIRDVLQAGARGFLLKDADPAELRAAVRAAYRGDSLLTAAVTDRLSQMAGGPAATAFPNALSEREREVLELLTMGARNKEIAARLFVAPKTVEHYLSSIFVKLDVSNRTEAARVALERGLVRK